MKFRTFEFFGPNWLTDFPACDWLVWLSAEEREALHRGGSKVPRQLTRLLVAEGMDADFVRSLARPFPKKPRSQFAFLFNSTAIALQRFAGHSVTRSRRILSPRHGWIRAVYETEHAATGRAAGRLALYLLQQIVAELALPDDWDGERQPVGKLLEQFRQSYSDSAVSLQTRVLTRVAKRREVPCIRLAQPPFSAKLTDSAIRAEGLLLLGQGVHRQVADGTFCPERSRHARPFIEDRPSIGRLLVRLGAPVPFAGKEPLRGRTTLDAVQFVERLGYPVVLKPVKKSRGRGVTVNVRNLGQLMAAQRNAEAISRQFLVERFVPGRTFRILVSGGRVTGLLRRDLSASSRLEPAEEISSLALDLARQLDLGMLVLTVVTSDISRPLEETGGAVVDLDVAPDLGRILKTQSRIWRPAVERYLAWLFAQEASARIPIVAMTGDRNSSDTAHMIDAIFRAGKRDTALANADGYFLNGSKIRSGRNRKYRRRMCHVLVKDRRTQAAIMEFDFDRLKNVGFPFDWCDVAVFGGVEAEQVQPGWETEREVAQAQRGLLERARYGAVLNADDPQAPFVGAKLNAKRLAWVSTREPARAVRSTVGEAAAVFTLEPGPQGKRVLLTEKNGSSELLPISELLVGQMRQKSGGGNEMLLAVAAAWLMDIPLCEIEAGLAAHGRDPTTG